MQKEIELAEPAFVDLPGDEHRDAVRLLASLITTAAETRHGPVPGWSEETTREEEDSR